MANCRKSKAYIIQKLKQYLFILVLHQSFAHQVLGLLSFKKVTKASYWEERAEICTIGEELVYKGGAVRHDSIMEEVIQLSFLKEIVMTLKIENSHLQKPRLQS